MFIKTASTFSSALRPGLGVSLGFAFKWSVSFKSFWPLALVLQALPAIILKALCLLGGAMVFHGSRPLSSLGFTFWLLGLTVLSRRLACGARLTFGGTRAFVDLGGALCDW